MKTSNITCDYCGTVEGTCGDTSYYPPGWTYASLHLDYWTNYGFQLCGDCSYKCSKGYFFRRLIDKFVLKKPNPTKSEE